jgi:hypothetical protein
MSTPTDSHFYGHSPGLPSSAHSRFGKPFCYLWYFTKVLLVISLGRSTFSFAELDRQSHRLAETVEGKIENSGTSNEPNR